MQKLGDAATMAAYHATLASTHTVSIEIRVLTLSGALVTSLRPQAHSGQVNIDADAEVTRSCTLTFLDESRSLQFDTDSPNDTALYFDNMIQVVHRVMVPSLGTRIACPVFTGPLVKFDRTGDEVSIEAQGKESLALDGVPTLTIPKGTNAVQAIRDILTLRAGEDKFGFPRGTARLPRATVVSRDSERSPWKIAKGIAYSQGLHLFYDGAGICRLRDIPTAPVFTFRTGEGGNITAPVQVTHDKSEIRNQVIVTGSKPQHTATVDLDDSHSFSSWRQGRNGVRKYFTEEISDPNIGSKSAARTRALQRLALYDDMQFGATWSSVPVPHLDELDPVRVETDEYTGRERLRQWSFPLTGGDMSCGYNDLVAVPRRRVRRA